MSSPAPNTLPIAQPFIDYIEMLKKTLWSLQKPYFTELSFYCRIITTKNLKSPVGVG